MAGAQRKELRLDLGSELAYVVRFAEQDGDRLIERAEELLAVELSERLRGKLVVAPALVDVEGPRRQASDSA